MSSPVKTPRTSCCSSTAQNTTCKTPQKLTTTECPFTSLPSGTSLIKPSLPSIPDSPLKTRAVAPQPRRSSLSQRLFLAPIGSGLTSRMPSTFLTTTRSSGTRRLSVNAWRVIQCLAGTQCQQAFDQFVGPGYRLFHVAGYTLSRIQDRYRIGRAHWGPVLGNLVGGWILTTYDWLEDAVFMARSASCA